MQISVLCLCKYLSKLFQTSQAETTRHHAKDLLKKMVVVLMMSVPDPFNGYHEIKFN